MWKYIANEIEGKHGHYIPGVPARDLTDEEMEQHPEAEKSGLYKKVAKPKKDQ